jgi:hypothetical protein
VQAESFYNVNCFKFGPTGYVCFFVYYGQKLKIIIQVTDSTVLPATRLSKTYLQVSSYHITLYVSTNISRYEAFKIFDENSLFSVL